LKLDGTSKTGLCLATPALFFECLSEMAVRCGRVGQVFNFAEQRTRLLL
jgi:hypothetical protein